MRPRDEPIPADEDLYRWVSCDDCNGDEVLPSAIDLARTSVNRAKYLGDPASATPLTVEKNGLAVTREERFPTNLILNKVAYEFFTYDDPTDDNDAHAEIRSGRKATDKRPDGDRPGGHKPSSKAAKLTLRSRLARCMQMWRRPVAVASE